MRHIGNPTAQHLRTTQSACGNDAHGKEATTRTEPRNRAGLDQLNRDSGLRPLHVAGVVQGWRVDADTAQPGNPLVDCHASN
jgi:hypothetical protein